MFLVLDYQLEPELLCTVQFFLSEAALVVGLLVALLLMVTAYLSQTMRRRAKELEAAQQDLEHEITERNWMEEKPNRYREIIVDSTDELRGKTLVTHIGDGVLLDLTQELGRSSYPSDVLTSTKQGLLVNLELSAFGLGAESLRRSEERFRNVADTAPVMLWMSDTKGLCTFCNQAWLSFTGRTLEQEIGNGWREGIYSEDLQHCLDTSMLAIKAQASFKMEYRLKRFDGKYCWILSTGIPQFMPNKSFVGYICSCIDITERKQTEEVLRKHKKIAQAQVEELEKLNQLKDEFLSMVSHELRTPVTNIKMCLCTLEAHLNQESILVSKNTKQKVDHSKVAHYLQILKDECEREIHLINDLLDLQQLKAGFRPLVLETIQLQKFLCQQVKPFRERANSRGQILQLHTTPELPPLVSELSSIERIVAELLNNACKYTPPGEHITVKARAESGIILLSVSNSGIEVSADELPHIFKCFYRIPQADRWNQGGTGLGLAFVQKLVERIGGSIHVESGSTYTCFTVKLPQALQTTCQNTTRLAQAY
jgi:PAS domain S-box-containing protein